MSLTKQEKKILDTFEQAFQYLTEEEKKHLYYFGLGMTFSRKIKNDKCGMGLAAIQKV